jgi:hypothetical protein
VIRDACAAPAELHDHALNKVPPAFAEIITSGDFVATSWRNAPGPASEAVI